MGLDKKTFSRKDIVANHFVYRLLYGSYFLHLVFDPEEARMFPRNVGEFTPEHMPIRPTFCALSRSLKSPETNDGSKCA
jgi:hypothetical protein